MKTTFTKGLWKTIVFLAVAIFCLSCEGCEEPLMKPQLEVQVESVADEAATIVASLLPNQPGTKISWRYKEEGSTYSSPRTLPTQFDGSDTVKVDWQVTDLKANTTYTLEVVASNIAGATVKEVSFTSGKALARIGLRQAEDVRLTSAKLTAWFVPNQPNTEFTFEYKEVNSTGASYTLPTKFSGTDSVKVSFDLSGLKENTEYTFRTRAKNIAGEKISDEIIFKTYAAVDADGNYYYAVTIGTQTWLQTNLKTTKFANGDPIPNVTNQAEWGSLKTPGMCWYDNNPANKEIYGGLYNFHVGVDARGLVKGYRVPTPYEWGDMMKYLEDGKIYAQKIMAKDFWIFEAYYEVNNSSGFSALPGGGRFFDYSDYPFKFNGVGKKGIFWTSNIVGSSAVVIGIYNNCTWALGDLYNMSNGFSIRLIKE